MKSRSAIVATSVLTLAGLAACASSPSGAPEWAAPAGPRAGTNFVVIYADGRGVHRLDTRTGRDSVLLAGVRVPGPPVTSTDGSSSAFEVVRGDSAWVVAARGTDAGVITVHGGLAAGEFTAAWSEAGMLGVGYRAPSGGGGGVRALAPDGAIHDVGCRSSDRVFAWQGANRVVVGDGRNVYTVDAGTCATSTTLPRQGKSDFAYAPDGRRLSFLMSGQQAGLYIAGVNGDGATRVADATFNPRNVQWSPTGDQLAFEIRSRQYANVTHVAVHDVPTGEISFADRPTELGLPSDAYPCWSPDGSALLHERRYARSSAAQDYTMRQLVVKAVATSEERIVSEELIGSGAAPFTASCWWADGRHAVVRTADSFDVIDVFSSDVFEMPASRAPLLVQAIQR